MAFHYFETWYTKTQNVFKALQDKFLYQTYESHNDKSANQAKAYNKTKQSSHRYLAYRDVPSLIKKYGVGNIALDYGSGTGISTQFLLDQSLIVAGADVSEEMIKQAKLNCPFVTFYQVKKYTLPVPSETYDLVFSSFVLFEIDTKEHIVHYLREAKRIMKPNGTFIAITGSNELYSRDWFTFNSNYSCNKNLKSGGKTRLFLYDAKIEFVDYYWTEKDYIDCFEKAGFYIVEKSKPLGKKHEPYPWKDEKNVSPFVIFVCKVNAS